MPDGDFIDSDNRPSETRRKTIIVGGGVAGLACAHKLTQSGDNDFVLLSENLGGRVITSPDHQVNYGAFYVHIDYKNLIPFVKLKRRIKSQNISIFFGNEWRSLLNLRNWSHMWSLLRFLWFLRKFRSRYGRFRRACEVLSQKAAMGRDPWLENQFHSSAFETIKQLGIEFWTERFFESLIRSTAFLDVRQISSFYFAACCLPVITPVHEFELQIQQLTEPFRSAIRTTKVIGITKTHKTWRVETDSAGCLHGENLVLATPISVTKELIAVEEPTNPAVAIYMLHLKGRLRPEYTQHDFYMLPREGDDIVLVREPNQTMLLYSRNPSPDATPYFESFEVITRKHWDPAFFIGTQILESEQGNGLFLIGDHSICSLEDAFITGLFAANRIIAAE